MAALTAFYNNFETHVSSQFGIHCSFGDAANLFGSPGLSWSGDAGTAASFFGDASLSNDLGQVLYQEDDLQLLGGDAAAFLQQLNYGSCNVDYVMHPNFEQYQELDQIQHYEQPHDESSRRAYFEDSQLLAASPQMCPSDESGLTTHDVTVAVESGVESELYVELDEIKHEPPPLNMKRLEVVEEPDESIEAAEVSVDLIQNRRPFQCGLAGCNKTFRNPQTMKMHHKTHYTDGSALSNDDALPTLTTTPATTPSNKKIPSRCPKCRKTFVGLYELRRHYGRKHSEGEKPFGCRKCGKRFYIEVDVRDHEKLCGEPIECQCGLTFAFKCNLVAHKKTHPACQQQAGCQELQTLNHNNRRRRRRHPAASNSSTTSDGESTSGTKRHRASITSRYFATFAPFAPDFDWLPKAARYDDFAATSDYSSEPASSAHIWSCNPCSDMHESPLFGGLDHLAGYGFPQPRKQELSHEFPATQSALNLLHRAQLCPAVVELL